jgi:A/G-specific adenine glycosylase
MGSKKEMASYASLVSSVLKDDISRRLLTWYDANARVLPWRIPPPNTSAARNTASVDSSHLLYNVSDIGYHVWVSEVMLQQTRVATVIEYYKRWMAAFPTVHALAAADLEQVNSIWQGLGYYRRARLLHEGAKYIVNKMDGQLPHSAAALEDIPGIGRYTAGAIASIAYGQASPVVDGNVFRVFARLFAIGDDIKDTKNVKRFWELAERLMEEQLRPGDYNQALMELGATVCTPKTPLCKSSCPLRAQCKAYQQGNVELYPVAAKKKEARLETVNVFVVRTATKYFIVQRPADGLLAGLWEFPSVVTAAEDHEEEPSTHVIPFAQLQPAAYRCDYVGNVIHIFSHIKQLLHVHHVQLRITKEGDSDLDAHTACLLHSHSNGKWVDETELAEAALPTVMRKVAKLISSHASGKNSATGGKSGKAKAAVVVKDSNQRSLLQMFATAKPAAPASKSAAAPAGSRKTSKQVVEESSSEAESWSAEESDNEEDEEEEEKDNAEEEEEEEDYVPVKKRRVR